MASAEEPVEAEVTAVEDCATGRQSLLDAAVVGRSQASGLSCRKSVPGADRDASLSPLPSSHAQTRAYLLQV